ncbi:MAG: GxxExxY protein [Caldilinea sp. CFX5]|nr:GxxExxY protein [Caldilinea sp. CFX5]
MADLLHADLTYYLRGAGFHIQNSLGNGHAEEDYEQALVYKLEADRVPFRRQMLYTIAYRGKQIGEYYPDLTLADGKLLLDLKATSSITNLHKAQMLSYLAVTGAELGFLMNFGARLMEYERLPNFLGNRPRTAALQPPDGVESTLTTPVLDALHTVYFTVGPGFLHQVYRRATRIELAHVGLNFTYVKELPLRYAGQMIAVKSTRFFWIEQRLLLATVAVQQLLPAHIGKLRWAMRELGCPLGLIANFYPTQLDLHFMRLS